MKARRRWIILAIVPCMVVGAWLWAESRRLPMRGEFVQTKAPPRLLIPPNASLKDKVVYSFISFRLSLQKRPPSMTGFAPMSTKDCSIHGLLNQCTGVTGIRYLIDKEVAGGTVRFGHTNTLKGPEWVAAFENVLQTGQPEWPDGGKTRKENLVLTRLRPKLIVVAPADKSEALRGMLER